MPAGSGLADNGRRHIGSPNSDCTAYHDTTATASFTELGICDFMDLLWPGSAACGLTSFKEKILIQLDLLQIRSRLPLMAGSYRLVYFFILSLLLQSLATPLPKVREPQASNGKSSLERGLVRR